MQNRDIYIMPHPVYLCTSVVDILHDLLQSICLSWILCLYSKYHHL